MKVLSSTSQIFSACDSRSGHMTSRHNTSTSSGVNTSGITWQTSQGSQEVSARTPARAGKTQCRQSSTRQSRCSTLAVSSAWAITIGQVVRVRCSGSRNRL